MVANTKEYARKISGLSRRVNTLSRKEILLIKSIKKLEAVETKLRAQIYPK